MKLPPSSLALSCLTLALSWAIAPSAPLARPALKGLFVPPPDRVGEPRDTGSGGSRGQCPADARRNWGSVLPLVPLAQSSKGQFYQGLTASARPELWLYLPETSARVGEFVLKRQEPNGQSEELFYGTKVTGNAYGRAVPPPPALTARNQVGASDLVFDRDGRIRRALLAVELDSDQRIQSLA